MSLKKQCKKYTLIKSLGCVWLYFTYILLFYTTHWGSLTWKLNLSGHIREMREYVSCTKVDFFSKSKTKDIYNTVADIIV